MKVFLSNINHKEQKDVKAIDTTKYIFKIQHLRKHIALIYNK